MRFLAPTTLVLLILVPLLVLLHSLRTKRCRQVVSNLHLWIDISENTNTSAAFQRLKSSPLLLLQVFFLLFLIVSLARPALQQRQLISTQICLVIDNSASMSAPATSKTASLKTRFDLAKAVAHQLVDRLSANGQMMIMDASLLSNDMRQSKLASTSDRKQLHEEIDQLPLRTAEVDFDYLNSFQNMYETVLITDSPPPLNDDLHSEIRILYVGENIDNTGITDLRLTRDLSYRPNIYVQLQHFGSSPQSIELQLLINDVWFDNRIISLPPDKSETVIFDLSELQPQSQFITAKLDVQDGLSTDNSAYLTLQPEIKPDVVLVSDRQLLPLTHLLATNPNIHFTSATSRTHSSGFGDIIIFDQIVPDWTSLKKQPEQSLMFLDPQGDFPFSKALQRNQSTNVVDQHRSHPIMQKVPLLDLQARQSTTYQLPTWATSLVEGNANVSGTTDSKMLAVPLIWAGERPGGQKVCLFGFDAFNLRQSRFAHLIPAMPMLVSQLIEWLTSSTQLVESTSIQAGSPVRLSRRVTDRTMAIRKPDFDIVDIPPSTNIFTDTTTIGIYTILVDGQEAGHFSANLFSASESDLSQLPLTTGTDTNTVLSQLTSSTQALEWIEVWYYPAFAALILLLTEWVVYQRSKRAGL